ncbi:MAG TPA: hypothetical protein VL490_03730, partial [Mucilaginibacter sp.]|nr:hypothetical protein [Mucilaginibacter sp.]
MKVIVTALLFSISLSAFSADHSILAYGAKADGKTINTKAIQAAVDQCSKEHGGRVMVPAGVF